MKLALLTAGLVLVAGSAVGCGGGDSGDSGAQAQASQSQSSSDPTSADDFCQAFEDFGTTIAGIDPGDAGAQIEAGKAAVADLKQVGTPEGVSADVSDGFDLFVRSVEQIPDDATVEQLQAVDADFTAAEKEQFNALLAYVGTECTPAS